MNINEETVNTNAVPTDEKTLSELKELENVCWRNHDYKALTSVTKQICDHLIAKLGPDDTEVSNYQVRLAFCYNKTNRKNEARVLMDDVYNRKCKLFGETSPSTIRTLCAKLQLYNVDDDGDVFFDMEATVRDKLNQIKDSDDIDVMHALYNYAAALGNFYGHSAVGVYEEILEWVVKFRCECSPEHFSILSELSDVYYELEFDEEAIELGEQYYRCSCKKHGEEDKYTLAIYENLAKLYFLSGNYDEALKRLDRLCGIYTRLDESPERIIVIYYNMAVCYGQKRENSEATAKLQAAYDLCIKSGTTDAELVSEVGNLLSALQKGVGHIFLIRRWHNLWGMLR